MGPVILACWICHVDILIEGENNEKNLNDSRFTTSSTGSLLMLPIENQPANQPTNKQTIQKQFFFTHNWNKSGPTLIGPTKMLLVSWNLLLVWRICLMRVMWWEQSWNSRFWGIKWSLMSTWQMKSKMCMRAFTSSTLGEPALPCAASTSELH